MKSLHVALILICVMIGLAVAASVALIEVASTFTGLH